MMTYSDGLCERVVENGSLYADAQTQKTTKKHGT